MFFEELHKIIRFFRELDENVILFDILQNDNDVQVQILDLVRIDQLHEKGIDSANTIIGFYAHDYGDRGDVFDSGLRKVFGSPKRLGEHYNFLDTSDFFRSFKLMPAKGFFETFANGQKEKENIFDKYGEGIKDHTLESIEKIPDIILEKVQDYILFKLLAL